MHWRCRLNVAVAAAVQAIKRVSLARLTAGADSLLLSRSTPLLLAKAAGVRGPASSSGTPSRLAIASTLVEDEKPAAMTPAARLIMRQLDGMAPVGPFCPQMNDGTCWHLPFPVCAGRSGPSNVGSAALIQACRPQQCAAVVQWLVVLRLLLFWVLSA